MMCLQSASMGSDGSTCTRSHKWVVLAAAITVTWLNFGFIFAFGALFLSLLDEFGESRAKTATVHSLLMGVTLSTCVVSGFIISRTGLAIPSLLGAILAPLGIFLSAFMNSILALDFCIGLLTPLGISLIYISGVTAIGKSFIGSQKLLALALQNSAISLSGLTYPYLFKWLLSENSFNNTLLIISAIFLNTLPAALIFSSVDKPVIETFTCCRATGRLNISERKPEIEVSVIAVNEAFQRNSCDSTESMNNTVNEDATIEQEEVTADSLDESNVQYKTELEERTIRKGMTGIISLPYMCLTVGVACAVSSLNGYNTTVLDIFRWKGYTEEQGLFSFLPFNISAMVARIIPGLVKQRKGVNSLLLPLVYCGCGCFGQLVMLLSDDYAVMTLGVIFSGIATGGIVSAGSVAVVHVVGQDWFPIGFGLIHTAIGIMSAGIGPLYGAIRDWTDSYTITLVITNAMLLVSLVVFLICMYLRYQHARQVRK